MQAGRECRAGFVFYIVVLIVRHFIESNEDIIKFNFIALSDQRDTYVHKIKLSIMRGIVVSGFRKKDIVLIHLVFQNLSILGEKLWAV